MKFTLIFLLAIPLVGRGQGTLEKVLTLQGCIDYALDNSISMQNARLSEELARAQVKETIGIGLPQITGSIDLIHNRNLTRFFIRYDTARSGFFSMPYEDAQKIGIDVGETLALENFFQLKNSGNASLDIRQLLFNGSYIVGLQASNTYKELSAKNTQQTEEEIRASVTKAYYNYLINVERLALFEANIARVDSLYRSTVAMNENGLAEKIDVDRLKVNLNNLRADFSNSQQLHQLSLLLLKFQMNYPYEEPLQVSGSIAQELFESVEPIGEDWTYTDRSDYQALLISKHLQELNLKNKYAEALPTLSAFATLGQSTQSPTFGGLFSTKTTIDDIPQLGPDKWYSYSLFGLNLNWSLFTGLQRTFQIQRQKLELQKIQNQVKGMEKVVDLEINQNKISLDNALAKLGVQKENMELADYIFKVGQIKYEEGVGSNLEVIEASTSLKEAQTNYYNAMYDAIIAKVDLQKSLGRLGGDE